MKKIYLAAICGTGMASLAAMLKTKGYEVSGVDENVYPPMSTFLEEQGIPVFHGFDAAHLANKPDLVVIGNALSRGNPEVEFVLNEKIPYISLPAALNQFFIRDKFACVVTGTHGKTTTSSMLAWILEYAGMQPSFFIGGMPENFSGGFQIGDGEHIVLEGDEYDSAFFDKRAKFLHYQPRILIINNIEFDHADIYQSLEEIKKAFRQLINLVPGNGGIIANIDDPVVAEIVQNIYTNVQTIGVGSSAAWQAVNIRYGGEESFFDVRYNGQFVASISISQAGEFNIRNALAAFVAASKLGISAEVITAALLRFQGVKRRLTLKAKIGAMQILDDFAHHATAIKQTLCGVRNRFPDKKIWAIFEPRSASAKRKVFEKQYFDAFDDADEVIIAPLHRPDKVPVDERLSVETIVQKLNEKNIPSRILPPGNEMLEFLSKNKSKNDIFLFMSNGNFADMPNILAERLKIDQ
ncbi:MAG: UDP-N-acetylmuramate:L-alanyl-gamma-D-glutamyl-meso-diaminopimelate ligase [Calditrichaeota bacterium]|nr:MAG: UDP-N-acetylmuramate:L-alanyl-gamma-D-glutamyl-meso-diaminopimelate ligase [Calditrichota bacterium]